MIYLLHGPDTVSSRTYLLKLRSNYDSWESVEPKLLSKNPEVFLRAQNLFTAKHLVIIENYLPKEDEPLPALPSIDVVIWTDKLVSPPKWVDKNIPFKIAEQFSSFKLADAIGYGQEKQALILLEKLLAENTPAELIIGSLTRQLRLLSLALAGEWTQVSKSSFLQTKVAEQVKNWDRKKLRTASLLLLKADWDIKSGTLKAAETLTILIVKLTRLISL